MRRRSREINIFNVSALDLFASALGAFILITVVLFPYFPNTGDSPERVATCKQALQECRKEKQRLERELARAQFPHLDLVIALDVTGSMKEQIDGLKSELQQLTMVLGKLAPSLGIGVVAFGDRKWEQPIFTYRLREVGGSPANFQELQRFIDNLAPNMGLGSGDNDDYPEAVARALDEAIAMPWRAQAQKRIIVVITDNPAYPDRISYSLRRAEEFARTPGQQVSTVLVISQNDPEIYGPAREFLAKLARRGKGEAVKAGGSMTAALLLALLG